MENIEEFVERELTQDREVAARLDALGRLFDLAGAAEGLDPARVVDLAARAVPHTDHAGLTLLRRTGRPKTIASTSEVASQVDEIQYSTGEGPCLEAIEDSDLTRAPDLATSTEWPRFAQLAVAQTPVRSMFAVRLVLSGEERAALNFYAGTVDAFDQLDFAVGSLFATVASLSLNSQLATEKNVNLEVALQSSRQIGMAMGVLMSSRLLTAEQAFEELREASQHLHRKLRDVAVEVTETGTLPEIRRD